MPYGDKKLIKLTYLLSAEVTGHIEHFTNDTKTHSHRLTTAHIKVVHAVVF